MQLTHEDAQKGQFSLANSANTRTVSEGIRFTGGSELTFSSFHILPRDVYYWVLPERFRGDKVLWGRDEKSGTGGFRWRVGPFLC